MSQPVKQTTESPAADQGSFGKIAMKLGYVTQAQLDEAVKVQGAAAKAGLRKKLGDILIKKGYLTDEQLQTILQKQTLKKKVGEYELLSKLGEGGMGAVFKAKQGFMDRVVALKILSPKMAKNRDFRERFVREARAVAKLNHPHIVAGYDVGLADGYCYFAMEFVDGETLGQHMTRKGGLIAEKEALEYIRQIAQALQHAHENNLLHRDVKPDNILLDKVSRVAKLADLGLARSSVNDEDATLTQAGQAVGTPFYISPEQARGLSDLTPATDLYSLGATLYHVLTGQVAYDGATAAVIMTRHLTDPVPNPRLINPDVSMAAARIVQKLMAKKVEERYESGQQVIDDIDRVLQGNPSLDGADKAARMDEKARPSGRQQTFAPPRDTSEPKIPTSSLAPIGGRPIRRKRRQSEVAGAGLILFILIAAAAAFFIMKKPPANNNSGGQKQPTPTKTTQASNEQVKTPAANSNPDFLPLEPALLTKDAAGNRVYKTDFEGKVSNFDVDPFKKVGTGQTLQVLGDEKNRALRLAPVKVDAGDYPAYQARLVFPADLEISAKASLTFRVCIMNSPETEPELQIWWSHKLKGGDGSRLASKWSIRDKEIAKGWKQFVIKLTDTTGIPYQSLDVQPLLIAFCAGKTGQDLNVFIDDIELIDPPTTAGPAAEENADGRVAPVPTTPLPPGVDGPARRPAPRPAETEEPKPAPKKPVPVEEDPLKRAL